ncbi:MAG: 23S rRNA (uracil(1939)-C(5))-methyltransferase RlmD [Clostridiales bacterium]|nr:23S rRNA (uracil(1939)-C(5))-methyltransferase RlmD [Clostridiales bacterium]
MATEREIPVKKNDVIEADIDGVGYEGEGVAHLGGYAVFVPFALPDERVRAHVIMVKPSFAVAKLLAVLRPAAERREPFCPHFRTCGGCAMQHIDYDAQTAIKRQTVQDTFRKIAKLNAVVQETVKSPSITAYRNKLSVPVRGAQPKIGFFAARSHRICEIGKCPIQFEENEKLLALFADFLTREKLTGYNEEDGTGLVRHLVARKIGNTLTVTVVVNGKSGKRIAPFYEDLREAFGSACTLYANFNEGRNNVILGEQSALLGGTPKPVLVDGLWTEVHPQSFFQVNDGVRQLLYNAVLEEVGETVLDAYSGAGLLSALMAKKGARVVAIEREKKATESAKLLNERNGISESAVRLVNADCAEALPEYLKNKPQTVVLDPPRSGCAPAVLTALTETPVQKIVYVSCAPNTLARDVAVLSSAYDLQKLTPFDMFPHCAGVETLAVLTKKE